MMASDLISRQTVKERMLKYGFSAPDMTVTEFVEDLPSAQPERIRGRWVYGEDENGIDGYHCNKCGFFAPWDYTHKFIDFIKDYHFCPNCGADMRDKEDGE